VEAVRAWYKNFLPTRLWPNGTFRILPGTAKAYLTAAIFVGVAFLIRWGIGFVGKPLLPFTAFYPAVLFATYVGGWRVGMSAACLGGLVGWLAFMPSHVFAAGGTLELPFYAVACGLLIWGAESYRRLASSLQNEESLRKLAVEELSHRLKNKIFTIQSILTFQLRDQPQLRDTIVARLVALAETDELIMAAQGRGAGIRDILISELEPYELSRVSMIGQNIFFPPRLALTMALVIHELATNAAKYGALSSAVGKLSIIWSVSDGKLSLEWRESGGPSVVTPTHRGFGLGLLHRALDQFNGSVEMTFEKPGLVCELKAAVPKNMASLLAQAETVEIEKSR
jgi:two-component sensor histidine kinase